MRGLFVTGTDTGVGKTVLSAALLAAMAAAGEQVRAHKPVLTGTEEQPDIWPADHVLLGMVAGMAPEQVAPLRFRAPASPHLAARMEGAQIDPAALAKRARQAARGQHILVLEGVGGLLVPLTGSYSIADLARELELPLLVAARPGLGTINHTLLTLRTARAAGLDVRAVVLTPWPEHPSEIELSNRETIERLGEIEVQTLPPVKDPDAQALAEAGQALPWRSWLAGD